MRDFTKQEVVFLCDMPLVKEEQNGKPFSEFSSMEAKTMLYEASMLARIHEVVPELTYADEDVAKKHIISNGLAAKVTENATFLHSSNVSFINLFSFRPKKGDMDYLTTICSKKNIPAERVEEYVQIEWLKDIWVHSTIYAEIQATIEQINIIAPKLIICAGKWATFFFAAYPDHTDKQITTIGTTRSTIKAPKNFGINNKLRGSVLTVHEQCGLNKVVLIPILTPAFYFQAKNKFPLIKADFLRCAKAVASLRAVDVDSYLNQNFKITLGTTKEVVLEYLNTLLQALEVTPTLVSIDIETRFNHIDCIGIAYKDRAGITIPFFHMTYGIATEPMEAVAPKYGKEAVVQVKEGDRFVRYKNYWELEDEIEIQYLIAQCFLHPNCLHVGQNYNYDSQFINKLWKLRVDSTFDTMLQHHSLFNSQDKDLATLASKYCEKYVYWKDELDIQDNETRWTYNCKDILYTLQICNHLNKVIAKQPKEIQDFYKFQQTKLNPQVVDMMNKGVLIDAELKEENLQIFKGLMQECLDKINYICNEEVNLNSTVQVKTLFKDILGVVPKTNRKSNTESFGADAMLTYLEDYPLYRTLLTLFLEYKSIKVFVTNFLSAQLDEDGKMRCSYNIAGTKTYRFASRKNVYGNGCNLANVPSKGKIDLTIALQSYGEEVEEETSIEFTSDTNTSYSGILKLPNVKKMFIPEEGKIFFDADYSAVDLRFVTYESDCTFIKELLKEGKDVYSVLASEYYQREIGKKDEERQVFKSIAHGCVTGDHEVLTREGWIPIEQLEDGVAIATCDITGNTIQYTVPLAINRDFVDVTEDLLSIDGDLFNFLGTQDHKFPCAVEDTIINTQAIELPNNGAVFSKLAYNYKDTQCVAGTLEIPISSLTRKLIKHSGTKVYCPVTATGFFLYRYKGNIAVSGNSNYAGKATTLAAKAGLSIPAVKVVQDWYFSKCPEIPAWHRREENRVRKYGYVTNVFGARGYFYDLTEATWLNKVVAWIGQSSTACLINRALVELAEQEAKRPPDSRIDVLLQVHDSLAGCFNATDVTAPERIKKYMELVVPYKDSMIVPAEIKMSSSSYGGCK